MWLKDFSRTAQKDWKLDAKTVNEIAAKEISFIQDLNRMKNAPAQMRQREIQFMAELQKQLGKKVSTDKFMRLKRTFYTRNQVYLTRETR
jgi:protein required for attachment to host cells